MADFRRRYSIPDDVFLQLAPVEADKDNLDENRVHVSILSIFEGGVHFSLHPLLCQTLAYYRLSPIQCTINFFRVVMGVVALNEVLGTNLGLYDIHHTYSVVSTAQGGYYLKARNARRKRVTHTPDSAQGDNDDFFIVTGN